MAVIIPRGWLRNRRPAPFDRRTPLIIPAGGGRVPPDTDYLGEIWTIWSDALASYYLAFYVPIRADWYYANVEPTVGQSRAPGSAPVGSIFFGPVAFTNTYLISGSRQYRTDYTYTETWPGFFVRERFSENGVGGKVKWDGKTPYYYWSEIERYAGTYSRYTISASSSGSQSLTVGEDGRLYKASGVAFQGRVYPPAPYDTPEWVHVYLGQSNPPIYPTRKVSAERGKTALLNPFMVLEKTGETEWEIKHVTPKTIDFNYEWYSTLLQGSYSR